MRVLTVVKEWMPVTPANERDAHSIARECLASNDVQIL